MINTPQAPYYDDFNVAKNFLKILFKPKLSVQTRELEQIQSMFQNQIETLASQIFQNGSVVSGGKFLYKDKVSYVKLYNEYNNETFNYNLYKDRYVCGLTTGITARVFNGWNQTEVDSASLYIDYLRSGDNGEQTFQPGEVIQVLSRVYISVLSGTISVGDILQGPDSGATAKIININNNELEVLYTSENAFNSGEQVNNTTSGAYVFINSTESVIYKAQVKSKSDDENPTGYGSAVYVNEGIYYIDGYFVHTDSQSKIISKYTTNTNARVGFEKEVQIITSDQDPSLLDNANGYPNENAPGADRLKINLVLSYYNTFETPSENFVEVMTITNSVVTGNSSTNQQHGTLLETLARRTYDESGNYTVNPFIIDIQEFLDENGNNGIYKESYFGYNTQAEARQASMEIFGQLSPGTSHVEGVKYYPLSSHAEFLEACRNRLAIGIEPGKAYVMGYEIENNTKAWYPLLKARDTKTLNNRASSVLYGNYIRVKGLVSLPDIYHREQISLSRDTTFSNKNIIGTARVYNIELDSGTPGSTEAVYRLYIDSINVTEGDFGKDVYSLGTSKGFSAKTIKVNGVNTIYGMNNTALIFNLEKSRISDVSNASYNYKKVFTGTVTALTSTSGTFTIPADSNSLFTDPGEQKNYILSITSGSLAGKVIDLSTISVVREASGNLTFSGLPADTIDANYIVIATLHKQIGNIKNKTLNANSRFTTSSGSYNEVILDHADGYRLVAVYESADLGTPATESDTNITDNFDFDSGQRDTYYDLARIRLKSGVIAPKGQLLVIYDYFTHSSGDYFTVESYAGQVAYNDIPVYTSGQSTYYLCDCIDIRPRVDDNGTGNFTSPSLPFILQNSSIFESDIEYYLPRMDLLELDYKGKFNVKYGTSSEDPQYPVGSINSMTLYYLGVPAYTESPDTVQRLYKENKRYTMRDIGGLDDRITAIEDYIELTSQELDTNNMPIFGPSGNQCLKTGFIVDTFKNHNYGDVTVNGYRCSVNPQVGDLRPDYRLNIVQLKKSSTQESTVIEHNGKYMIPSTTVKCLSNSINTSAVVLNSNGLVSWVGNVQLESSLSNFYNPEGVTNINYGESVISGPIFGQIEISWLGTQLLKFLN